MHATALLAALLAGASTAAAAAAAAAAPVPDNQPGSNGWGWGKHAWGQPCDPSVCSPAVIALATGIHLNIVGQYGMRCAARHSLPPPPRLSSTLLPVSLR